MKTLTVAAAIKSLDSKLVGDALLAVDVDSTTGYTVRRVDDTFVVRGAFGAAPVVVAARGADLLATLTMLAGSRVARLEVTRFDAIH